MANQKKYRWNCPLCGAGCLAPGRARKNDIRRYCVECSVSTGKLVERVCGALEKKRTQKAERVAAKSSRRPSKPRKTKRSWMREKRYVYSLRGQFYKYNYSYNIMEVAEKMCSSAKWNSTVKNAAESTRARDKHPQSNNIMKSLWKETMKFRGASGKRGTIRISKSSQKGYSVGRAGNGYGVTVTASEYDAADNMTTLLHELTHIAHLSHTGATMVNGKRRPHNLMFNLIMCRMAKAFWGYGFHPYEVGYSVGKGYAPTRHLSGWLLKQIGEGNPRVMKWFTDEEADL